MMFLPADAERREEARRFCEEEAGALGLTSEGWRVVPVDQDVLGPLARETAPAIEQWIVGNSGETSSAEGDTRTAL